MVCSGEEGCDLKSRCGNGEKAAWLVRSAPFSARVEEATGRASRTQCVRLIEYSVGLSQSVEATEKFWREPGLGEKTPDWY